MIVAKTYFFFLYFEAQVHFDSRLIVQKLESRFATQECRHVRDIGLKNKQELTSGCGRAIASYSRLILYLVISKLIGTIW